MTAALTVVSRVSVPGLTAVVPGGIMTGGGAIVGGGAVVVVVGAVTIVSSTVTLSVIMVVGSEEVEVALAYVTIGWCTTCDGTAPTD